MWWSGSQPTIMREILTLCKRETAYIVFMFRIGGYTHDISYMHHVTAYRKSGNSRCKNIFVVDSGYEN